MYPLPKFLDPGSFGVAVFYLQTSIKNLFPSAPEVTGSHDQEWLEYVKKLQSDWRIQRDGGMGPEFRSTLTAKTGLDLNSKPHHYAGGTVYAFGSRRWGVHSTFGPTQCPLPSSPCPVINFLQPQRQLIGGGDGLAGRSDGPDVARKVAAESKKTVVLIGEVAEFEVHWWRTQPLFRVVELTEQEVEHGTHAIKSALQYAGQEVVVVSSNKDMLK